MTLRRTLLLTIAIACLAITTLPCSAQNQEKVVVQPADKAKYGGLAVLPSCTTFSVERGDPTSGPSLLLIKAESGCVIPWHWHTAPEELMLVDGTAKLEMKGESAQTLTKGAYVHLPGRHHHQFTCQSQCLMFNNIAGTFDIHYLDKSGNEIPVAQALQAVNEKPGSSQ